MATRREDGLSREFPLEECVPRLAVFRHLNRRGRIFTRRAHRYRVRLRTSEGRRRHCTL